MFLPPIPPPIQKERLRIRLEFGKHETADDARSLVGAFSAFRPRIFVSELAGLDEPARQKMMAEMRSMLLTDEGVKRLISLSKSGCFFRDCEGYMEEEMRIVAMFRPIGIYLAESGGQIDPISLMCALGGLSSVSRTVADSIRAGEFESALDSAESCMRAFVGPVIVDRNELVVEGMERLLTEARALFPGIVADGDLRVLVRYGAAHAAVADMLRSRGFDVEANAYHSPGFNHEITLKMSRDFRSPLSHEDRVKLVFDLFFAEACRSVESGDADPDASVQEAYRRIGGEAGFISLLKAAAESSPDPAPFKDIVYGALIIPR